MGMSADEEENPRVASLDKGLYEYYKTYNQHEDWYETVDDKQVGKFERYCIELAIDDDSLEEDLTQDPEDCLAQEFDKNEDDDENLFPLSDDFKEASEEDRIAE